MQNLSYVERRIISAVVDAAAARGYLVSVHDGEEWAVKPTGDMAAIREAVGATCETMLRFRDPMRRDSLQRAGVVGSVWLIHGNGCDVIADYSDNPAMAALLAPALAVAELADQ